MSWFSELAGKAENLLNNLDEQTGAALRNHNVVKLKKHDRRELAYHDNVPGRRINPRNRITESRQHIPPIRSPSKSSPSHSPSKERSKSPTRERAKSPARERKQYNLKWPPRPLVEDLPAESMVLGDSIFRSRRSSFPFDLTKLNKRDLINATEKLEIENMMLKNELNVFNQDVADMTAKLNETEKGEAVVSSEMHTELGDKKRKLCLNEDKNKVFASKYMTLQSEFENLKGEWNSIGGNNYKEKFKEAEMDMSELKTKNTDLEIQIEKLRSEYVENEAVKNKIETELRHAQTIINNLNVELERSNFECKRLEKEWEAYKYRVKSMLISKDKELKALQDGVSTTEDTKMLEDEIECLRQEREDLSETVKRVRSESSDVRQSLAAMESRLTAAERVVVALRDALKDERAARNRAEAQHAVAAKELKSYQLESGHTIAELTAALQDRDAELGRMRQSSSAQTSESALNVADYDNRDASADSEKLTYLTETLVQKQGKIDSLLADNNMLKIQLEKMDNKYRKELLALKSQPHSVLHVSDADRQNRLRSVQREASLVKISRRLGVWIKQNPLFRMFIVIYMIGLHFWVLTVLFTSTPDYYVARPSHS